MPANVLIPTPLRKLTGEQDRVETTAANVGEVLTDLGQRFPGLTDRICDASGDVRRFVNIYVNGEDIRFAGGKEHPVKDGDEVSIVPAIAGGATA